MTIYIEKAYAVKNWAQYHNSLVKLLEIDVRPPGFTSLAETAMDRIINPYGDRIKNRKLRNQKNGIEVVKQNSQPAKFHPFKPAQMREDGDAEAEDVISSSAVAIKPRISSEPRANSESPALRLPMRERRGHCLGEHE